jgi:hypothetical protein
MAARMDIKQCVDVTNRKVDKLLCTKAALHNLDAVPETKNE